MWYSLCECVRSRPTTASSTATLFFTLVHSVHFNSSHWRSIFTPQLCASFSSNRLNKHYSCARP